MILKTILLVLILWTGIGPCICILLSKFSIFSNKGEPKYFWLIGGPSFWALFILLKLFSPVK